MGLLDSYPRDSKRQLSIDEKLEAIRRVTDLGETKASVSRMYGVPESTLRGWCKNKDKLAYLSVSKRASEPKRKSDKKETHYDGLLMPVRPSMSPETKKVRLDVDVNGFPDHRPELTPPAAHGSAVISQPPQMQYDFNTLIQLYCHQARQQEIADFLQLNPDEPLSLVKKPRDRSADSPPPPPRRGTQDHRQAEEYDRDDDRSIEEDASDDRSIEDESALEAIGHGELFLKWLEGVSDPSITRLQLMQFRQLLDKVKAASFSRQIKST